MSFVIIHGMGKYLSINYIGFVFVNNIMNIN